MSGPVRLRITGGTHRGRGLRSTRDFGLRPTSDRVRGAIFSILGSEVVEGARVLDLYSGTGALAIEALSRGADWADFVEADLGRAQRIQENLHQLALTPRGRVYQLTVERALDILPGTYELVFADPPYDTRDWTSLMGRLGQGDLIGENGVVVVEHRYGASLAARYGVLLGTTSRRYGDTVVSIYRPGNDDA